MDFSLFKFNQRVSSKHFGYSFLLVILIFSVWNILSEKKMNIEQINLSSVAKTQNHMQEAEIKAIHKLSTSKSVNSASELPKRFRENPAFKLFVYFKKSVNQMPDNVNDRKPASKDQ